MSDVVRYVKEFGAGDLYLGSEGSAGIDLCCKDDGIIGCGETKLLGTGLRFELPPGKFMMIVPRSSMGLKTDVTIPNSPGILDSDYRGELGLILRQGYPTAFFSSLFVAMGLILLLFGTILMTIENYDLGIISKTIFQSLTLVAFFASAIYSVVVFSNNFGFKYKKGDRLAQMIILDYKQPQFELVDSLTITKRGEGGFGSTGKS